MKRAHFGFCRYPITGHRTRHAVRASLIALGSTLLLAGLVSAAASLLWEDTVDFAGQDDTAAAMALAGPRVITAGTVRTALGVQSFYVRAADALDGTFRWDDRVEFAGGPLRATDVAVSGPRAFVVGQGDGAAGDYELVRAYDWRTGTLLWDDEWSVLGNIGFPPTVTSSGDRVFVATNRPALTGLGRNMLVKAYDAGTGALLWEDLFNRGGDDFTTEVVASGALVFVAGAASAAPFPVQSDFAVRALDAATGAMIWQDFYDFEGEVDQARGIVVSQNRVYAVGFGRHADLDDDIIVRAYDAGTGVPLWTDTFDRAGGSDFSTKLAVLGPRVFVAGYASDGLGDTDFLVRALDADSGTLLWQDLSDGPGNFDWAMNLDGRGDRLYVVGRMGSGMGLEGDFDGVVRAYDAAAGTLAWEDRFGSPGAFDSAGGITIGNRAAYVRGSVSPAGNFDWTIRAYALDRNE
jgi:hypothetical protein